MKIRQIAIVGEAKVDSPHLPLKWVNVFEANLANGGIPDVRDHVERFDRITLQDVGNRTGASRPAVEKGANTLSLKEGYSPAILVLVCFPTSFAEPLKRKYKVGLCIGIHSQNLAHVSD